MHQNVIKPQALPSDPAIQNDQNHTNGHRDPETNGEDQALPRQFQEDASSSLANQTILLVDDDPDIRALARTFLEHIGFRVLSSADPDRAAQIFLASSRVDLLITDQNMPGRSGMELARQLTTLQPDLPVLMISGAALEPGMSDQFTQPGWKFLPKPFALPALLDAVHAILACMLPRTGTPSPAI